ncbi:hypothetical protein HBH69_221310 [Parastagonospora nodorum]|nr:hypothetical protein HBI06_240920 [Parastagonospora nodorum]KAH4225290.1 hypothetical protein HBI05_229400 [Parastagonospora nodorum]KAH4594413.1 hypothetical protein HBH82_238720 [Parastagonospora nodorum]KAH4659816.1 hypothetical protein HBH78_229350 [Parastagonospora nodorum]KAH4691861.1 hypothetical protein HBH67_235930 [Parastagonospora nodorum]
MYHQRDTPSRRAPQPDDMRASSHAAPAPSRPPVQPPNEAEFLIIGLFALRLTQRMIDGLADYAGRDADRAWLTDFLAPYPRELALAKVSGCRKNEYIANYQDIVSRMKRQPRYPMRFMQMNPDRSQQQGQARREAERETSREMTDLERLDIIDFCDAAGEWGSTVPIPAREAERMIELADQRRIADLGDRGMLRGDRHEHGVC